MKSHRRRRRRIAALALAACAALAVPAGAMPVADHESPTSARIGDTPADFAQPVAPAPRVGDTPADFAQPVAPAPRVGDTPVDHPGASRAPEYTAPPTVQVVRPERTIVREVDQVLPLVISSAALLLALGGCAVVLAGSIRRRRLGTS
jgi:hypothetical protein